jgi:hypothetical protein
MPAVRRNPKPRAGKPNPIICMGVKAVVAAGWAVDDAAAKTFATSFYTHLFPLLSQGGVTRSAGVVG